MPIQCCLHLNVTEPKIQWFNQKGLSSSLIRVSSEVGNPWLVQGLHNDISVSAPIFCPVILSRWLCVTLLIHGIQDRCSNFNSLWILSRQEKRRKCWGQKVKDLLVPFQMLFRKQHLLRAMSLFSHPQQQKRLGNSCFKSGHLSFLKNIKTSFRNKVKKNGYWVYN